MADEPSHDFSDLERQAAYSSLIDLESAHLDAEARAMAYREALQEAQHLLYQAREHALRQGRTIVSLRRQLAQAKGVTPPDESETSWL